MSSIDYDAAMRRHLGWSMFGACFVTELVMGIISRFTAVFLLLTLSISVNLPIAEGQDDANRPAVSRLQQLLNRRVEQLRKVKQILTMQYESGEELNYDRLLSVQMKLHEAELEAAETPEARLAVLEAYLKTAKMIADLTQARFQNGDSSQVDCLMAQATATGIEIRLVKARVAMGLGEEQVVD